MTDRGWGGADRQGGDSPVGKTDNSLTSGAPARQRVLDQIEIWRKELVNLARSNRLLYFRHTKSSTLEIVREPDQTQEVVGELLAGRSWRFYMPPDQRASGCRIPRSLSTCSRLARRHRFGDIPMARDPAAELPTAASTASGR